MSDHKREHARLLNKFIALCKNRKDWPNVLYKLGFHIQIEKTIRLDLSKQIVPDVIAVSNRLAYIMVVDCKSGGKQNKQEEKYLQLTEDALLQVATVKGSELRSFVVCYACNESNNDSLKMHTKLPLIEFLNNIITSNGDFKHQKVNDALKEISLVNMREPYDTYYTFSPDEENHIIVKYVMRGLMSYYSIRGKRLFTVQNQSFPEEILKLTHTCHEVLSDSHKGEIIKKIGYIIDTELTKNQTFRKLITKLDSGNYTTRTLQSLTDTCEKIIQKYKKQARINDY